MHHAARIYYLVQILLLVLLSAAPTPGQPCRLVQLSAYCWSRRFTAFTQQRARFNHMQQSLVLQCSRTLPVPFDSQHVFAGR